MPAASRGRVPSLRGDDVHLFDFHAALKFAFAGLFGRLRAFLFPETYWTLRSCLYVPGNGVRTVGSART